MHYDCQALIYIYSGIYIYMRVYTVGVGGSVGTRFTSCIILYYNAILGKRPFTVYMFAHGSLILNIHENMSVC